MLENKEDKNKKEDADWINSRKILLNLNLIFASTMCCFFVIILNIVNGVI